MHNKNKILKITAILISLVIIIIISILIFKKFENNNNNLKDNIKFKNEYKNISEDNIYTYATSKEIINILEKGTGVIYLGFPSCEWCQAYVKILNDIAKEEGIEKIYYYNIYDDRKNNTINYQKLIKILNNNLMYDDEGKKRIFVPDVYIVKEGKIIGHDNESSVGTKSDESPEKYWTDEKKDKLKIKLKMYFNELKNITNQNE